MGRDSQVAGSPRKALNTTVQDPRHCDIAVRTAVTIVPKRGGDEQALYGKIKVSKSK